MRLSSHYCYRPPTYHHHWPQSHFTLSLSSHQASGSFLTFCFHLQRSEWNIQKSLPTSKAPIEIPQNTRQMTRFFVVIIANSMLVVWSRVDILMIFIMIAVLHKSGSDLFRPVSVHLINQGLENHLRTNCLEIMCPPACQLRDPTVLARPHNSYRDLHNTSTSTESPNCGATPCFLIKIKSSKGNTTHTTHLLNSALLHSRLTDEIYFWLLPHCLMKPSRPRSSVPTLIESETWDWMSWIKMVELENFLQELLLTFLPEFHDCEWAVLAPVKSSKYLGSILW